MVKLLSGPCAVCSNPSQSRCSMCYSTFYCGPDHQKAHWKTHKPTCKRPFELEKSMQYGRYMVAAKDLGEGDLILKEKAVLVGPSLEDSPPVCLSCYKLLGNSGIFHPCQKCKAPLCSRGCEESPVHQLECFQFKQCPEAFYTKYSSGSKLRSKPDPLTANYQIVIPIRALLLKKQNIKKYKALMGLQSHSDERKDTPQETRVNEGIVEILQMYRQLDLCSDTVQNICGIVDTNGFELAVPNSDTIVTGLFPEASMMMHSCYKNTRLTFGEDYTMSIYARVPIKKGEVISHSYAKTFTTTTIRRITLFSGKHFGCECVRCTDPTELGSFCSALICLNCCRKDGSNICPVVPVHPLDLNSLWRCLSCNKVFPEMSGPQIAALERNLMVELESISKTDLSGLENFCQKYQGLLHPNHATMMVAKQSLSIGYGRFDSCPRDFMSNAQLWRKVSLCREVLSSLEKLENGIAAKIGLAAFELGTALTWAAEVTEKKDQKQSLLKEAKEHIARAADVMSYEANGTYYDRLCQMAQSELLRLEKIITVS